MELQITCVNPNMTSKLAVVGECDLAMWAVEPFGSLPLGLVQAGGFGRKKSDGRQLISRQIRKFVDCHWIEKEIWWTWTSWRLVVVGTHWRRRFRTSFEFWRSRCMFAIIVFWGFATTAFRTRRSVGIGSWLGRQALDATFTEPVPVFTRFHFFSKGDFAHVLRLAWVRLVVILEWGGTFAKLCDILILRHLLVLIPRPEQFSLDGHRVTWRCCRRVGIWLPRSWIGGFHLAGVRTLILFHVHF